VSDEKIPASVETDSRAVTVVTPDRYIHSDVFDRLVRDAANDIPGLVAYGIYQARKREWIAWCKLTNGSVPNEQELKNYSSSWRDDALAALRSEADGHMFRFAEAMMEQRTSQMMKTAIEARVILEIADLKKEVKKVGSLWHHVIGHVAGFGALVVLATIVGLAIAREPHLRDFVGWIFQSH
jgi:hypothetical protein